MTDTVDNNGQEAEVRIDDYQFIQDLKRLKELRSFLLQEAVSVSPQDSSPLSFGRLNLLRYSPGGRAPSLEEWSQVEAHTQSLFRLLSDPLRRRFILGGIPSWVSIVPGGLALVALLALVLAISFQHSTGRSQGPATISCYLVWLMALGAIGSVAFIGMNALSVQQDVTFDLSNRRLMVLRIVLGALFGLVLTLPFGFQEFSTFVENIFNSGLKQGTLDPKIGGVTTQAVLLLLPFILGFSTSLVIMVLNRLVDAVQAFFGRSGTAETQQTASVSRSQIPPSRTPPPPPPPPRA